jgi:hypothetical protein
VSVPLETGPGVLGALTAAGSPKMERRAVEGLAARLAEALLRRTMEGLLKASLLKKGSRHLHGLGDAVASDWCCTPKHVGNSEKRSSSCACNATLQGAEVQHSECCISMTDHRLQQPSTGSIESALWAWIVLGL